MQSRIENLTVSILSKLVDDENALAKNDSDGMSIWHYVAQVPLSYEDNTPEVSSLLRWLLRCRHSDINVLSDAGETPFCVALKNSNLKMADYLLDFGSDPTLYSDEKNDPFSVIDKLEKNVSSELRLQVDVVNFFDWQTGKSDASEKRKIDRDKKIQDLDNRLKDIKRLHQRMTTIKNYEVRKNATLLAQAKRSNSMPMAMLPDELLLEIGAQSKWFAQTTEEAKKSVRTAFFKPKQAVVKPENMLEYEPKLQEATGCIIS